jgi:acyl-CoA thioesterase-1
MNLVYMTVLVRFLLAALLCISSMLSYAEERKATPSAPPQKIIISAYGDEMIFGGYVDFYEAFPATLERQLMMDRYSHVKVYNNGGIGETSADGMKRLDQVLFNKPHIVLLAYGFNDIMDKVPANTIYFNLLAIIKALKEKNIKILLIGIKPPENYDPEYVKKINGMYRYLAKTNNIPIYQNFMEGVSGNPALCNEGGLYPNRNGVKAIVSNIAPNVEKLIGLVGQKK